MKIGMDAYYLNKPKTSMGIFQFNILKNIIKRNDLELYIFTDAIPEDFKDYNNAHFFTSNSNIIKRNIYMRKILNKISINVFYATFNIIPVLPNKKYKIVLQNHDWSHGIYSEGLTEKLGGDFYKFLHKYSCIKSNINISNSQFTAKETKKYSNKDSIVIYHDADPFYKDRASKTIRPDLNIPEKYILYVGRVYPKYKNIRSLLYAYNKVKKNADNLGLIIVHSDNFRGNDMEYISKNNLNIIDLKSLSKKNVKYLYEHAFVTIYPSLYEGFGSPIIEAQSSGSPMIISSYGPMPEVGGNASIYFDGTYSDLHNKIIYVLENPDIRQNLIEMGYKNIKRFNWNDTAGKTLEVILNA